MSRAIGYPEASHSTTTKIISALVQLFSSVGFPDEILIAQRTNFTSRLMKQLYLQVGITAVQMSPYHPQTNGQVGGFNQTLKENVEETCEWYRERLGQMAAISVV